MEAAQLLEKAAARVRRFIEEYGPERLYVLVSGGVDSAVAALAVASVPEALERTYVVYNEVVGNTHHLNIEAAYEIVDVIGVARRLVVSTPGELREAVLSTRPPAFIHVRAVSSRGRGFLEELVERGPPPWYHGRWCHREFKARYWEALPAELHEGRLARFIVAGVRSSESPARRRRWTGPVREFRAGRVTDIALAPLYDFLDQHVLAIAEAYGLVKTLEQYRRFGSSLGCIVCPLRGVRKQASIFRVLASEQPQLLEKIREAVEKMPVGGRLSAEKKEKLLRALRDAMLEARA